MLAGEINVQTLVHPSGRWITVPITVWGIHKYFPVIDTGSPVSVISPATADTLLARRLTVSISETGTYLLTRLTVEDQPLPDLVVRVLPRLSRIAVQGLLGL